MISIRSILTACLSVALLAMACLSSGCASSAKASATNLRAGIPPQAELVTSAPGQVTFKAPETGRIYAYNATRNHTIGRYSLREGQTFVLDGNAGRATIDGNEVMVGKTRKDDTFQIYFEPRPLDANTPGSINSTGSTTSSP